MREADEPANVAPRLLWATVLALLGFAHPLFFLFAVLVGISAWIDVNANGADKSAHKGRRRFVEATDPDWRTYFRSACESPAEEAFLEQAILHFGLRPVEGILTSPGLALHLQVEISNYRVDFLAHDWLVIEVDGAAWHSSDAAIAQDQERDRSLEREGYRVLRLPAKLVFAQPADAMRRVESAIAEGSPERPRRIPPEVNFGKAIIGLGAFVSDVNRTTARLLDVQKAMEEPRRIVDLEQRLLDGAIEFAERKIRIAEYRATCPNRAEFFDKAYQELTEALEQNNGGSPRKPSHEFIHLGPILRPPAHTDSETWQAIENAFDLLLKDRSALFSRIRERAIENQNLAPHAVSYLEKFGCKNLWRDATDESGRQFARSRLSPHDLQKLPGLGRNYDNSAID